MYAYSLLLHCKLDTRFPNGSPSLRHGLTQGPFDLGVQQSLKNFSPRRINQSISVRAHPLLKPAKTSPIFAPDTDILGGLKSRALVTHRKGKCTDKGPVERCGNPARNMLNVTNFEPEGEAFF